MITQFKFFENKDLDPYGEEEWDDLYGYEEIMSYLTNEIQPLDVLMKKSTVHFTNTVGIETYITPKVVSTFDIEGRYYVYVRPFHRGPTKDTTNVENRLIFNYMRERYIQGQNEVGNEWVGESINEIDPYNEENWESDFDFDMENILNRLRGKYKINDVMKTPKGEIIDIEFLYNNEVSRIISSLYHNEIYIFSDKKVKKISSFEELDEFLMKRRGDLMESQKWNEIDPYNEERWEDDLFDINDFRNEVEKIENVSEISGILNVGGFSEYFSFHLFEYKFIIANLRDGYQIWQHIYEKRPKTLILSKPDKDEIWEKMQELL